MWALHHSRQAQRTFDTSRSYNVLGDLMCRAGQLQWSHVCLITSTQLLPAGSEHKARHLNSLATVLIRQQQFERAETLLMTSLYLARDTGDHNSFWHALARLQFVYNTTAPTQQARQIFSQMLPAKNSPIAQAYLALAETDVQALAVNDSASELAKVLPMLKSFPVEATWFCQLLGLTQPLQLPHILHWQPADIKDEPTALTDAIFLHCALAENAMHWLLNQAQGLSQECFIEQKNCFFI